MAMLDQSHAINNMKELDKEILFNINGGLSISGSLINAFNSSMKIILDIGRNLGSSIRRLMSNNYCNL